ncbi:MAG: hypothetical protein U9Q83_10470 [Bacteroidota bacterium]|nr:hypothetical protein [Bacteroidota bacterium]
MNKKNMFLLASILFFIASFKLHFFAFSWIGEMTTNQIIWGFVIAIPHGLLKYKYAFLKMNKKNLERINSQDFKQVWYKVFNLSTYILIFGMIAFGLTLRIVFKVPKHILMPVYLGIGIALGGAVFFYFKHYLKYKLQISDNTN